MCKSKARKQKELEWRYDKHGYFGFLRLRGIYDFQTRGAGTLEAMIVSFVVGLFVGSTAGILVTAMCVVAKGNTNSE